MNVFITGISGFIGQQLLKHITTDNRFEKIYCLCRSNTVNLPINFTAVHGSLDDLININPIDADVCIHLAAVTNSANTDSDNVFRTNSDGTESVVEFCKKSNIPKIIFLSSVNVYLTKKYTYALSKLDAEEHIKKSELEFSILRCSLVYGKGCPSFEKILRYIKLFHIVPVFGKGEAYEQPIYIDEVCHAIISHTLKTDKNKICDLYGKTKMSYNDIVKHLALAINTHVFLLHLPQRPFVAVSEFCYRHKIPFPIQPEQIFHMCEDLCFKDNEENLAENYKLEAFSDNLRKYIY